MKKIRIAQIGTEHDHSPCIMKSLRKNSDLFEVVGYANVPEEHNILPTEYEGVPSLTVSQLLDIPDLDAVTIETSEANLSKYALLAAERGLPIHMDKPGSEGFEELISMVKSKGTILHLGYMYRYNPAVIKLLNDIKLGKYGNIQSVEAQMSCWHSDEKRQWLKKYDGGMMYYLGCHLIDLILQIKGMPEEILPFNCSTGINGTDSEDNCFLIFKYSDGISFAKTSAAEAGGYMRRQLVVSGTKGSCVLEPLEAYEEQTLTSSLYTGVREVTDNIFDWKNDGVKYRTEKYDRYDTMMRSFASYINGERVNPYTYDYELELYKILMKCCKK